MDKKKAVALFVAVLCLLLIPRATAQTPGLTPMALETFLSIIKEGENADWEAGLIAAKRLGIAFDPKSMDISFKLFGKRGTPERIKELEKYSIIPLLISSHKDGDKVPYSVVLKGITQTYENRYLWVFAHKETLVGMWWPQGGHAVYVDPETKEWEAECWMGTQQDVDCNFVIVAMWVGEADHQRMTDYVLTAQARNWPPVQLPSGSPSTKITVRKVRH